MGIQSWHAFCFKKSIALPDRLVNMNSNVSPVSAAQDFQRQSKLNPSARLGIEALVGIGAPGSNAPSFSNTLKQQQQQQQLRADSQPQQPPEPVRQAEQARSRPPASPSESAPAAQAESAPAPDQAPGTTQQQPSSGTNDAQSAQSENGQADASGKNGPGAQGTGGESSAAPPSKNTEAADAAAANPLLPPATDLPALIAALLPGLQAANAAKPAADSTNADALAGDSGKKSLQNSGLLPTLIADGRKGAQAGGRQGGNGFGAALAANATARTVADVGAGTNASAHSAEGLVAQLQARQPLAGALLPDGKALVTAQTGDADGLHALTNLGLPHVSQRGAGVAQGGLQLPVATPTGREAWAEDVGNQVRWMLGRAESKAELVLTPPNMGKLEVSITLNGDQTTAQFVASSQAARDALEQALPRLREILQQAGISLGQTNVSTSGEQGAGGEGSERGGRGGRGTETSADTSEGVSQKTWLRQHDGLVDTFV